MAKIILFVALALAQAQQPPAGRLSSEPDTRIIELRQADLWSRRSGFDAEILTGNVIFFTKEHLCIVIVPICIRRPIRLKLSVT